MSETKLSDNLCQFSVKNLTLESLRILALDTSFVVAVSLFITLVIIY